MVPDGFNTKKALGQNFLTDRDVVRRIVDASCVSGSDIVLEIGPGMGVMTEILSDRAGYVAAVEIDRDLMPVLDIMQTVRPNLEIIYGDIMRTDVGSLIGRLKREHPELTRVRVVANLPYYITTPIIMMFLEQYRGLFDSLTFMVQKEVAERLTAAPGGKEYGAISVTVAYYTAAQICFTVPASCFHPRPKVDSAVVNMSIYTEPPVKPADPAFMFRLVKAAFAQRRKMLVNAVANAAYLNVSKAQITDALASVGLDPGCRGETLSMEQFARLSDFLTGC